MIFAILKLFVSGKDWYDQRELFKSVQKLFVALPNPVICASFEPYMPYHSFRFILIYECYNTSTLSTALWPTRMRMSFLVEQQEKMAISPTKPKIFAS